MDFEEQLPRIPRRLADQAQELGSRALDWYADINDNGLADQRPARVRAQLPWLTTRVINTARENNVIGRDKPHRGLNLEELMTLHAVHEYPNVMSRPRNSKDLNPKHVDMIIGTVIEMSTEQPAD